MTPRLAPLTMLHLILLNSATESVPGPVAFVPFQYAVTHLILVSDRFTPNSMTDLHAHPTPNTQYTPVPPSYEVPSAFTRSQLELSCQHFQLLLVQVHSSMCHQHQPFCQAGLR